MPTRRINLRNRSDVKIVCRDCGIAIPYDESVCACHVCGQRLDTGGVYQVVVEAVLR